MSWSTNTKTQNRQQSSILLALKPDGHGLTVVGDDAQSIYSFRAATVRNARTLPGIRQAEVNDTTRSMPDESRFSLGQHWNCTVSSIIDTMNVGPPQRTAQFWNLHNYP